MNIYDSREPSGPDPFRGRRGPRGPKRFIFTYQDIARVCGCSYGTVRNDACNLPFRPSRFDPKDLESLARYIVWRLEKIKPTP